MSGVDLPPELARARARGVRVAVLDTGVDDTHAAFSGPPVAHFAVVAGEGGRAASVEPTGSHDPSGHGTAVASIIRRYAPEASLASVRVVGRRHAGTTEHLFTALDWAISEGYDVINVSLGSTYLGLLARFKQRVDAAFVAGSVVVSASNNADPAIIEYPAHFPSVVSTTFAELPPLTLERVSDRLVEFRACGVDVRVAWRGGASAVVTGSSFAAPHVAALAARMRELHPTWNAVQVKASLYDLATPAARGG